MGKSRAKKHRARSSGRGSAAAQSAISSTRRGPSQGSAAAAAVLPEPASLLPPESTHEPAASEIRVCARVAEDLDVAPLEQTPPAISGVRLVSERIDEDRPTGESGEPAARRDLAGAPPEAVEPSSDASPRSEPPQVDLLTTPSAGETNADPTAVAEAHADVAGAFDDSFFGAAPTPGAIGGAWDEDALLFDADADSALARKSLPEIVARRAKLTRYVAWVVGVASLVCLVAAVRGMFVASRASAASPTVAAP